MRKFISLVLFSLAINNVSAYEVDDYVTLLQWKIKWEKITSQAIDGYVERGLAEYPASFTSQQTSEASKLIRNSLSAKIGWKVMKEEVISGFRTECGDDLLDVMVEFYAGAEFSQQDREFIANGYASCARASMQGAMGKLISTMESFIEEKEKIISTISEK